MTFSTIYGCVSVIVIDVIVHDTNEVMEDTLVCYGAVFEWNGFTINEAGIYSYTTNNVLGCDSVYRNVLIEIKHIAYDTLSVEICTGEQYNFNGNLYTTSDIYTDRITNDNGCDSFITL